MAEAVATFALAGNVLQFLEVVGKLVKKGWSIYNSDGNALKDLEELHMLTSELQNALKPLRSPASLTTVSSGEGARFGNLPEACFLLAQELLDKLERIGVFSNSDRRKTLLTALKARWESSEIADLQRRIEIYRQQLATGIVASLRFAIDLRFI